MDGLERAELKDRILNLLNEAKMHEAFNGENLYLQLDKPVPSIDHLEEVLEELYLEAKRYIHRESNQVYGNIYQKNEFTPELIENGGFVELFKVQQERQRKLLKEQQEIAEDLKNQRIKNKYQARLAKWQVKTFWWLFFLGIIGGGYSIYQIAVKIFNPKEVVTKKEFEQFRTELEMPTEPIKIDTIK